VLPLAENLLSANLYYSKTPLTFRKMIGDKTANVAAHKHCLVCGNAVGREESFCDELCESKFKSSQRRQQLIFLIFVAFFLGILILPTLLNMKR
jgi:predicted nucleic acid-binding Zn ribbon protein